MTHEEMASGFPCGAFSVPREVWAVVVPVAMAKESARTPATVICPSNGLFAGIP